jgi:eukaryotic-like serine/threonine-protein kinase
MPTFQPSRLMGTGTYGRVYECREQDEHGTVVRDGLAIKYLGDEWLDDEPARNRFRREVRLTRGLEHQGIVPILYSNLSAKRPYIVMPLATSNLTERLQGGHAEDRGWSLTLFTRLVHAMSYAHARGVVHRDLKPDNVLLLKRGPVISDFGMGKDLMAIPTAQTKTSQPMGTLLYMAPEQWTDARSAGYPADVFSLGKLLWELLANRQPRPWEPELDFIENEQLRGFIGRCTLQEPSMRYRDAQDALRAWSLLDGGLAPARHPLDQAQALIEEWARSE